MYKPTNPDKFENPQIILTSDRLILNAKNDSILFFAKQAISLSAEDSIHINCSKEPGFIINAPQIHLGLPQTKQGAEYKSDKLSGQHSQEFRLIKGEILRDALNDLLDSLNNLTKSMSNMVEGKEGAPYAFIAEAQSLNLQINKIKKRISDSLSTQNFTI
jgi:hypothetical protein